MRTLPMAGRLARGAARFAIFRLRKHGQRSGNRSPKCKTPPQAEASAIDGQAEGEAQRAHGGRPTGDPDSVGANRPRTDEHLLQLPMEAYPDCRDAATIFMGRHPNFTLEAAKDGQSRLLTQPPSEALSARVIAGGEGGDPRLRGEGEVGAASA